MRRLLLPKLGLASLLIIGLAGSSSVRAEGPEVPPKGWILDLQVQLGHGTGSTTNSRSPLGDEFFGKDRWRRLEHHYAAGIVNSADTRFTSLILAAISIWTQSP